jgi:uncharacterized membrane protein
MSLKGNLQPAWQEWKHGAQIFVLFAIHCIAGCVLAMAVSIVVAESIKWAMGDASQDKSLFMYCSFLLGTAVVPFMAGTAMKECQKIEDRETQEGISL